MSSSCYQMTLSDLLPDQQAMLAEQGIAELQFCDLTIDSRKVEKGSLFVACQGGHFNGLDFIDSVIERGAVGVLVNTEQRLNIGQRRIPVIGVEQLEQRLAELGSRFYHQPSARVHVVGVTGTNGKTSTSHFIAQALDALYSRTAVVGTIGNGFLQDLHSASHTTPDALALQRLLASLVDQDAVNVVMEVSSHALDQNRVAEVAFDQAVFTNLSRDHLDYHGDMMTYGGAKQRLFSNYPIKHAIVNIDDKYAETVLKAIPKGVKITAYGMEPSSLADQFNIPQIYVDQHQLSTQGLSATLVTPWGSLDLSAPIIGVFNLYNLMAMVAVLGWLKYPVADIAQATAKLQGVPGRMQSVAVSAGRLVVVDYAHTPDALEKALLALKSHCQNKLWNVFGCGGDRDTGKRAEMARISAQLADCSVVTSDNPRTEDPSAIIDDVMMGFSDQERSNQKRVVVEIDRRKAIAYALANSGPGDVVLIAGKGHEDYQEVHGVRQPFDDCQVVSELLDSSAEHSLSDHSPEESCDD